MCKNMDNYHRIVQNSKKYEIISIYMKIDYELKDTFI
jgi:hypothetical protein